MSTFDFWTLLQENEHDNCLRGNGKLRQQRKNKFNWKYLDRLSGYYLFLYLYDSFNNMQHICLKKRRNNIIY